MKIAITGGIASGKTTVMNYLKEKFKGAQFYSVDEMVGQLYNEGWWKDWLVDEFGTYDKKELSKRAFAQRGVRLELEAMSGMHIGLQLGKVLHQSQGLVFVEFPLIFETSMQQYFNEVVLVTAPKPIRVKRAIERGMTEEHVASVMLTQWPDDVKLPIADWIVDTGLECTIPAHLSALVTFIENRLG